MFYTSTYIINPFCKISTKPDFIFTWSKEFGTKGVSVNITKIPDVLFSFMCNVHNHKYLGIDFTIGLLTFDLNISLHDARS